MKLSITLFFLVLLGSLFFMACNQKNSQNIQETAVTEVEPETPSTPNTATTRPEEKNDYIVASLRKTPCYGKCPVYEARFYQNGKVTYVGKMFVEREGTYTSWVSEAILKSIRDKVNEVNYWDFYHKYPVGDVQISDLPSTVSFIRIGDMEKEIINKHEAPQALKDFEKWMEDLIESLDWVKVKE